MTDFLSHVLAPIALILLGGAMTYAYNWHLSRRNRVNAVADKATLDRDAMKDRISEMERQLSVLGSTVQPLSLAFQTMLVKQLTHFHTPVLDKLLAGLGPPFTLSQVDETKLLSELADRSTVVDAQINDSERDAARMLPMVIKRVRASAAVIPNLEKTQVVIAASTDDKTGLPKLVLHLVKADTSLAQSEIT